MIDFIYFTRARERERKRRKMREMREGETEGEKSLRTQTELSSSALSAQCEPGTTYAYTSYMA